MRRAGLVLVSVIVLQVLGSAPVWAQGGLSGSAGASAGGGSALCCKCHQDNRNWCINFGSLPSCSNFSQSTAFQQLNQSSPTRLQGFSCDAAALTSVQCAKQQTGGGGQCPDNPSSDANLSSIVRAAPSNNVSASGSRSSAAIIPRLNVNIPGLVFSAPIQGTGCTTYPWLSQYITAIFRYLLSISLVVATVMVVYGGFRYLVGASTGDIQRGKSIVIDAIIGMLIAYGAYTILYTINPQTLTLHMPCMANVTTEQLMTMVNDALETSAVDTSGEAAVTPPAPTAAAYQSMFPECPLTNLPPGHLDTPRFCGREGKPACTDHALSNDPRTAAFAEGIVPLLHSADPRQRILEVAEAATKCGVHMRHCGYGANTIWRIAGVTVRHNEIIPAPGALVRLGISSFCGAKCTSDPVPGCSTVAHDAVVAVRAAATDQEARANLLQPGDQFVIYNANSSCGGSHAAIFIGWQGNMAKSVWGGWSENMRTSNYPLKGGGNFSPLLHIYRASELITR